MKKYIYTFAFFACAILISRHVVSDLKQEERIWALEQQMESLRKESLRHSDDARKSTAERDSENKDYWQRENDSRKATRITNKTERRVERKEKHAFDTLKFATPIILELNTIDSATLTKIPGIGAKSASMIIRYREQLGGFVSPYQIGEKLVWESAQEKMDEWCRMWMKADTALVRKLNVNEAEFREILRHPYVSFEQTKALVNYRDKHKRISGEEVLYMLEEFTEDDIARLRPYLSY